MDYSSHVERNEVESKHPAGFVPLLRGSFDVAFALLRMTGARENEE